MVGAHYPDHQGTRTRAYIDSLSTWHKAGQDADDNHEAEVHKAADAELDGVLDEVARHVQRGAAREEEEREAGHISAGTRNGAGKAEVGHLSEWRRVTHGKKPTATTPALLLITEPGACKRTTGEQAGQLGQHMRGSHPSSKHRASF